MCLPDGGISNHYRTCTIAILTLTGGGEPMTPQRSAHGKRTGCCNACGFASVSERIGANLKVDHLGVRPFSRLTMEGCARTPCGPDSFALPAGLRVVEAPVHPLGEETNRIRYPQYSELAVDQGNERIRRIAGNDGRVLAQPQRVELVHPD